MSLSLVLALLPQTTVFPARPERPRDPWVFRSVLDGRARMVTLALSDEMWVAYDAASCSLYKAWQGGVQFAGAVYTNEHGPQPTTAGARYTEGLAGDVWQAEVGGVPVAAKAEWRGYELSRGQAILRYDIRLPDGRKIAVRETPEFAVLSEPVGAGADASKAEPRFGLERQFVAEGLAADVRLALRVRIDGDASLETVALEDVFDEAGPGPEAGPRLTRVVMTADRPRAALILLFPAREMSTPSAPAAASPGEVRR